MPPRPGARVKYVYQISIVKLHREETGGGSGMRVAWLCRARRTPHAQGPMSVSRLGCTRCVGANLSNRRGRIVWPWLRCANHTSRAAILGPQIILEREADYGFTQPTQAWRRSNGRWPFSIV